MATYDSNSTSNGSRSRGFGLITFLLKNRESPDVDGAVVSFGSTSDFGFNGTNWSVGHIAWIFALIGSISSDSKRLWKRGSRNETIDKNSLFKIL